MNLNSDTIERIGDRAAVCEPPPELEHLLDPPFVAHRWIVGGHLQSVMSLRARELKRLRPDIRWVDLPDGDRLAILDDCPDGWLPGDASVMVVHGLCGCSAAPYMLRLASRFTDQGVRVFRLNLRGCGEGVGAAKQITHAGRSGDVVAALACVAELTQQGPISAVGVSLGGNQLLRAFGLLGSESNDDAAVWLPRIHRIAAISPPLDLKLCSDNMERRVMRPYNRFFIRYLLERAPAALRDHPLVTEALRCLPKTMRQLDDRVTAPLGGFRDALDYYHHTTAHRILSGIQVPTLILAASDDPIVPVACFDADARTSWSDCVRMIVTRGGGHVGFIGRGTQRHWMDGLLDRWFEFTS